jgi:hypothetical protein
MTVTFRAEREGTAVPVIVGNDAIALLDDGNASEARTSISGDSVTVLASDGATCVGRAPVIIPVTDDEPPLPFNIEIARTENVYDGDYFASYHTTDSDSGVAYYEVRESSSFYSSQWIRHPGPYRLHTQGGSVQLSVRAVDNVGNVRTESMRTTLEPVRSPMGFGDLTLLMVAGALAVLILWHVWHQRDRE